MHSNSYVIAFREGNNGIFLPFFLLGDGDDGGFSFIDLKEKNRCFNGCERVLMRGFLIEGCRTKDGSELDWLSFFNWRDVILKGRGYCFLIWLMMG